MRFDCPICKVQQDFNYAGHTVYVNKDGEEDGTETQLFSCPVCYIVIIDH